MVIAFCMSSDPEPKSVITPDTADIPPTTPLAIPVRFESMSPRSADDHLNLSCCSVTSWVSCVIRAKTWLYFSLSGASCASSRLSALSSCCGVCNALANDSS